MSGWAGAVRAARRTARRNPGRTALVMTLIALPVAVVVAGDTLARTGSITPKEALPHVIGHADALIQSSSVGTEVEQDPTMTTRSCECPADQKPHSTAAVLALLPKGSRLVGDAEAEANVSYRDGLVPTTTREIDLADPATAGLYEVSSGRLPTGKDEVAVSPLLVRRGFGLGTSLPVRDQHPKVVGVLHLDLRRLVNTDALAVGSPGSLGIRHTTQWLAVVPGGLSWKQVLALNHQGLFVMSRKVVDNPPPRSQVPNGLSPSGGGPGQRTFLALVVTLAVVQVVLLAAPAFAVGARRQRRELAMIGATGGAPKHVRRFVLAQGVVLGGVAGLLGAALGVVLGIALRPTLSLVNETAGPLEISWRDTAVAAAVGMVSAVLAALVPALVAGRQDVLVGLTGRRGSTGRSLTTLVAGVVALAVGVVGCVSAAKPSAGTYTIVYAALPTVLGAALLAPTVIALVSRRVGALPFSMRFALRDAARSRGRTAAAAAAVTATVAGAVSLGIGGASDSLQGRSTYESPLAKGTAIVSGLSGGARQVAVAHDVLARRLPTTRLVDVSGLPYGVIQVVNPKNGLPMLQSSGGAVDADVLVGVSGLDLLHLPAADLQRARAGLASTGAVVLVSDGSAGPVRFDRHTPDDDGPPLATTEVSAYVQPFHGTAPVSAVITPALASRLGIPWHPVGIFVDGTMSKDLESRINEELSARGAGFVHVERGWQGSSNQRLALLVVGITAALLVLGGTLSASLLALADAKPDFGTLMAVGAPPAVRRRVAASYAAVVGLLGSLLGAVAGFAPGIAVSYPLTRGNATGYPSHYLDIPWTLVLGLCLGVPAVAALGAAVLTRSRLPLAARVET